MSQLVPPASVAQFKAYFIRDFSYGPGLDKVRDADVQNALNATYSVFNPRLFSTAPLGVAPDVTSEAIIAYLNASAHFLATALQAAGGLGAKGKGPLSQGEGVYVSKGVSGVSAGFVWPSTITSSPVLFQFAKTAYGQAYLQVLMTRLVGNVSAVFGETADIPPTPFF